MILVGVDMGDSLEKLIQNNFKKYIRKKIKIYFNKRLEIFYKFSINPENSEPELIWQSHIK